EAVQPTYAQSTTRPASGAGTASRVRKPTLDEMTVGRTEVPVQRAVTSARPNAYDNGKRRGRPRKTGRPGA
ncbi:MAG TPA: hypothetical protein PK264_22220, partial [Hyphomicrobiaceae bacterium]|nr:hypothetical protein [Hyphomicrobiaceae bacterium]